MQTYNSFPVSIGAGGRLIVKSNTPGSLGGGTGGGGGA